MKQRWLSVMLALVCVVGVGAVAWWGFQRRTSPGPLHSSHAGVSTLTGASGCAACHNSREVSLEAACLSCHERVKEQGARRVGIHGKLDRAAFGACETCHHEHLGDSVALVSDAAFRAVGVEQPVSYDHSHVAGYTLAGGHRPLACAECHPNALKPSLAKGEARYLGLSQACASCHEDVHKGELGQGCAECHGQERPFKDAPLFSHPKTFALTEGHAGRACAECHTTPKVFTGLSTACASCHADTFDATTKPAHRSAGLSTDCAQCHTSAAWTPAKFTHPDRFALLGAHRETRCEVCHAPGAPQQQVAAFKTSASCVACHTSPHEASVVNAAGAQKGELADACAVCHRAEDTAWREGLARTTPALHAATGFPLEVPHDTQKCAQCHAGLGERPAGSALGAAWKNSFPGRAPDACEACHEDPHRAQFAKTAAGGACLRCHARTAFTPSTFDLAAHDACGFALDASHRAVACGLCHEKKDGVRAFVGTTRACAGCHKDVHAGTFDKTGMRAEVEGKTGCARCHDTTTFARVAWDAEAHREWTGEALTAKHASASCDACHRRETAGARAPFAKAPTSCAACHSDVHAGQFETAGATDCARCHKSTDSFRTITFDHQKDSRYVPDAEHQKLECGACHKTVEFEGRAVVRYKPLGIVCGDCHDPLPQRPRAEGAKP